MKKQLKQDLKIQEAKTSKSGKYRWLLFLLLALIGGGALFPAYQQWRLTGPERLLANGIKQESLGQIDAAEKSYQKIYRKYPDSKEAEEALYLIGKLWQYDFQDDQKALLYYLQLEHDYPESQRVQTAREEAAQIVKYSQRDYSRAIGFYQRLLELDGGTSDQYLYEIADCYFRLENYSQARIELEMLLEKYPDSDFAADALYRKGAILLLENRPEDAREDWQKVIEKYPDSGYRAQAEFNLAKLLEEQGHLSKALEQYRKLEDFPRPSLLEEKIEHLEQRIQEKKKAI